MEKRHHSRAPETAQASFLEGLYIKHKKQLFAYFSAMLGKRETAEEALQILFVKLFKSKEKLSQAKDADGYLFASARHVVWDLARQRRKHGKEQPLETAEYDRMLIVSGGSGDLEWQEQAQKLQEGLLRLAPHERDVVTLHVYQNRTFQQIADMTGENINTLIYRYQAGIKKLKQWLRPTE